MGFGFLKTSNASFALFIVMTGMLTRSKLLRFTPIYSEIILLDG